MGVFRSARAYPVVMRVPPVLASALVLLVGCASGCVSVRPFLPEPGYTSKPAEYRPQLQPTEGARACRTVDEATDPYERERRLRDESFCLLELGQESGIPRLLEIALLTEGADATENAGALAADTSERELYAMLVDPDPRVVRFALESLDQFTYRLGTWGKDQRVAKAHADAARPLLVEGCAFGARWPDAKVQIAGLACLARLRVTEIVPEILEIATDTTRPVAVRRTALEAVQATLGSIDDATLDAVAGIVALPIPSGAPTNEETRDVLEDELLLRDEGCVILRTGLRERKEAGRPVPTRAVVAAESAYADMERRSGNHVEACREVASTYGTNVVAPAVEKTDWFGAKDLEYCDAPSSLTAWLGAAPVDLCVVSIQSDGGGRRFAFELRDGVSPRTLAKADIPVTGNEYVDYARTATLDLDPGLFISLISITNGAPDVASIVTPRLYVFDAKKVTWTEAWRGAPCPGCAPLTMTLAFTSKSSAVEVDVGAHRGGMIQNPTKLAWDGKRISPR